MILHAKLQRGHSRREATALLTIDIEGAEYIRDVMESEWIRCTDFGAKDIRDALDAVVNQAKAEYEQHA